jgi:hypothetical protein
MSDASKPVSRRPVHELLKLNDEEFVRNAYLTVLGRAADPTGLTGYLKQVRRGADKVKILVALATSAEGLRVDRSQVPGLKEMIEGSKTSPSNSSFLARAVSRVMSGVSGPLADRVQETEYRLEKLSESVEYRLRLIETGNATGDTLQAAVASGAVRPDAIPSAHSLAAADEVRDSKPLPTYARRSRLDRRRRNLERAFGSETVTDQFFAEVVSISRQVHESNTVVCALMDDVIIARWKLSGTPRNQGQSFDELTTQLDALHYSVFACSKEQRAAAEMEACNGVAARALASEIAPTSHPGLSITAFMLCALNAHPIRRLSLGSTAKRDSLCRHFFLKVVPEHKLGHYITPAQRSQLCRPAAGNWGSRISLLQSWLLESDPLLQERFPPSDDRSLGAFLAWYFDEGVWDHGLDYSLSQHELCGCRLTISSEADAELLVPSYFRLKGLIPAFIDSSGTEDWLRDLISIQRQKRNIPWRLFDPVVFDYLWAGHRLTKGVPDTQASKAPHRKHGLRRIRPGEVLSFGQLGNGVNYLIGQGWSRPEGAHVWTNGHAALLAMNLSPEDDGPLEVLIEYFIGPQPQADMAVVWNGRIVENVRTTPNTGMRLHCMLGENHRMEGTPNILCLFINQLFQPSHDGRLDYRTLGLALSKLQLVKR